MIDEKKITQAAHFATDTSDLIEVARGMFAFSQETLDNAFKAGISWYLDNIWHPASEEPKEPTGYILYAPESARHFHVIRLSTIHELSSDWETTTMNMGISRWLYIDDLLKGGFK